MGEWRFQQVWIALAAEVTNLHTVGLGVMVALCMDLKWVAGFGSCRGNQAEQDPNCLPP